VTATVSTNLVIYDTISAMFSVDLLAAVQAGLDESNIAVTLGAVRVVDEPTMMPSTAPSVLPSSKPSEIPTRLPSSVPSVGVSEVPSYSPSEFPSDAPSILPSSIPSEAPSQVPSMKPSNVPSIMPSYMPSERQSAIPSVMPTLTPSVESSANPSATPSVAPSFKPSVASNNIPSMSPSHAPFVVPSTIPSSVPSNIPSFARTIIPSDSPSNIPSSAPTTIPSKLPSDLPSDVPSVYPSAVPSVLPSSAPSAPPSDLVGFPDVGSGNDIYASDVPSSLPTSSLIPSSMPSATPTKRPSKTQTPSHIPSASPSSVPSSFPSTLPSINPTMLPSKSPSDIPTNIPSISPSDVPTRLPSTSPSDFPSKSPSDAPSSLPSAGPSFTPQNKSSFLLPYRRYDAYNATTLIQEVLDKFDDELFEVYDDKFDDDCTVSLCRDATNRGRRFRRELHKNPNQRALVVQSVNSSYTPCPAVSQEDIDNGDAQALPEGDMCHDVITNVTMEYYPYRFKPAIVNMTVTEYFEDYLNNETDVKFEPDYPVPKAVETGLTLAIPGVAAGQEISEEDREWLIDFMRDFLGEFLAQYDPPIKVEDVKFVGQEINTPTYDKDEDEDEDERALHNDEHPLQQIGSSGEATSRMLNATNANSTSTLIVTVIVEAEYLPPPEIASFSDVVVETMEEEEDVFVEEIKEVPYFENVTEITASAPPKIEVAASHSEPEILSKPAQMSLIITSWCIFWSAVCYLLYIKLMGSRRGAKKRWRQKSVPDGGEERDESLDSDGSGDKLVSSDPYTICAGGPPSTANLQDLQISTVTKKEIAAEKRQLGRRS